MKLFAILALFFFFAIYSANSYEIRYDGHLVIRCSVETTSVFQEIVEYSENNLIDIWRANIQSREIDINLSNQQFVDFNNQFSHKGIKCENMIDDLQKALDDEQRRLEENKDSDFFKNYQTYDAIIGFMKELQAKYSFLYMTTIGNTTQGNTIYGIEMNGGGDRRRNKRYGEMPTIYFQGCQHAREWIAPATVLYILNSLAEGYGTDPTITRIVDDIYWVFVPVVNVDGYNYTRTDRMWRKNRRAPPSGSTCYGVDTNRNWPSFWNRGGSSSNPCSDTYMGISPASEVEVQSIMTYFQYLQNVAVSTDWHAYSQLYITPWAWSTQSPSDLSNMTALGNKVAAAIKATNGQTYQVGSTAQVLYVASGSFNDWQYDSYGIVYTQCIELRDTGRYGFLLPADQIIPTGQENLNGVIVQALHILGNTPIKRKN